MKQMSECGLQLGKVDVLSGGKGKGGGMGSAGGAAPVKGVPLKHKGGGGVRSVAHVPHLAVTNGPAVLTVFRCGLVRVYRAPG